MSQAPKLSTTSYVILGHLALRDWSTYELARQMTRSTRQYWPRAESKIYEEPKKLVAHGFASARREYTGSRPRTVYSITAKGRRALRKWLDEPGGAPVVESEGVVKALFAERGSKAQLIATLQAVRAEAERTREANIALAAELSSGGPFPDRIHVNELVFRFMWEQNQAVLRWVDQAEADVARWPDDITTPGPTAGAFIREIAALDGC